MYEYDPQGLLLTWGPIVLDEFMDGTMIRVEFDEDRYTKSTGGRGFVTRTKNSNEGAKLIVTLTQGALANALISARKDEVWPLSLVDGNGTTIVTSEEAWPLKPANIEFAKEATGREWTFDMGKAEVVVGGGLST